MIYHQIHSFFCQLNSAVEHVFLCFHFSCFTVKPQLSTWFFFFFNFCVFIDIPWQYILNKNVFISNSNPEHSQYGIFLLFFQMALHAKLCLTLCSPMNCSLPGSFIHGILQARIFLTQGSNLHLMSPAMAGGSLPLVPPGKPCKWH